MSDDPGGWFDWLGDLFNGDGSEGGGSSSGDGGFGDVGDFIGTLIFNPITLGIGAIFLIGAGISQCASGTAVRTSAPSVRSFPDPPDIPDFTQLPSPSPSIQPPAIQRPQERPSPAEPSYSEWQCVSLIRQAQIRYGRRYWEDKLPPAARSACRRQILEARRAERATPAPSMIQPSHRTQPPRTFESEQRSVNVPLDDLDLSKPSDAEEALRRIKRAASRVCGGRPDARDMFEMRRWRKCVADETSRTVALLNSPLVTELHRRFN